METQLKQELKLALEAFDNNRYDLLKAAHLNGGRAAADQLQAEYDQLRNAYFELMKKQLAQHSASYQRLMQETLKEASALRHAINQKSEKVSQHLGGTLALTRKFLI